MFYTTFNGPLRTIFGESWRNHTSGLVGKTSKKVPVTHGPSLLDFPSIYLYVFFAN